MEATLSRKAEWRTPKSTLGLLTLSGDPFWCYTLERAEDAPDHPAIPAGRYQVVIDFSPHFERPMPHILGVPGREGIRIHSGNESEDSEGCILVGFTRATDWIGLSRAAFAAFFVKLTEILSREEFWISVDEPPAAP